MLSEYREGSRYNALPSYIVEYGAIRQQSCRDREARNAAPFEALEVSEASIELLRDRKVC